MATTESPSPTPIGQGLTDSAIIAKAAESGVFGTIPQILAMGRAIEAEVLSKAQDGLVMPPVAAPVSQQESTLSGWISVANRLPDVPTNGGCEFIIACRRSNGQTYVFAAEYLNAKMLMVDDDECPEEGMPFSGWYRERNDNVDYDSAYELVCEESGDEITHWMPLPPAPGEQLETSRFRAQGGNTSPDSLQNLATSGHDATGAAIPQGWRMRKDPDGVIVVQHDKIGGYVASHNSDNIASTILYHLADDLLAATAPSEADKLDAARSRWLREPSTDIRLVIDKRGEWVPPDESIAGVGGYYIYEYRAGEELDAAIDAAIAAEPAQPAEGK